jgi:DNA-directed RNA polymerase subunit RPC12/RpoP
MQCSVCGKDVSIKLMPDHASSGMWCNHCGVRRLF